jgi:hypothetical protein
MVGGLVEQEDITFLLQWHGMATREKTTTNERLTKALPGD